MPGRTESFSLSNPDHEDEPAKRAFTEAEAAYYLGCSQSYLRQSRCDGHRVGRVHAPPWIRFGRNIRYLREDLDAWLDSLRNSDELIRNASDQVDGHEEV